MLKVTIHDIKPVSRPFKFPSNVKLLDGSIIRQTRAGLICPDEDAHDFDSAGQCRICKCHRRPV